MKIIDLTLPIVRGMPGIPGIPLYERHPVRLEAVTIRSQEQLDLISAAGISISDDCERGSRAMNTLFSTTTHVGTHVDAPRHFYDRGMPVDEIPLERIVGEAVVIDVSPKPPDSFVTARELEATGIKPWEGQIAVIKTTWTDRMWGHPGFWERMPYLDPDVGDWILERRISAVAVDCFPEKAFWRVPRRPEEAGINHIKWLGAGIIIIQFLTNLSRVNSPRFTLVALPLKLKGADGAPARVIAIEE